LTSIISSLDINYSFYITKRIGGQRFKDLEILLQERV